MHPLRPGASAGTLSTGNIQYASGSTYVVELNGATAGSGYDQVNTTGTVSLGGSTLSVSLGFTPSVGQSFTIIKNDGADAVIGTFNGLAEGATFSLSGMLFQISYVGGEGNDVVLTRISYMRPRECWTGQRPRLRSFFRSLARFGPTHRRRVKPTPGWWRDPVQFRLRFRLCAACSPGIDSCRRHT